METKTYAIKRDMLKPLRKMREALEAVGFPLANNLEFNAPDSVIRIKEGWALVGYEDVHDERIYTVKRVDYKEFSSNDL